MKNRDTGLDLMILSCQLNAIINFPYPIVNNSSGCSDIKVNCYYLFKFFSTTLFYLQKLIKRIKHLIKRYFLQTETFVVYLVVTYVLLYLCFYLIDKNEF